ncbi:hypothetical protein KC19_5G191400 [Ceratodon purpureus]|uniref:Uncharacterized protein n=1 Tax=Ceratodon purpureus TaxID=3225 RepID=A0A8T0I372_CERPU|nr:hypothetical protein KC19_5G191400 [Ceratodon purpureus]
MDKIPSQILNSSFLMLLLLDRMYVLEILAFSSTSFKFPKVTVCKIWFEFIEGGKEYAHPGFGFCGGLHRLHSCYRSLTIKVQEGLRGHRAVWHTPYRAHTNDECTWKWMWQPELSNF